jgi:hypothetical protein
VNKFGRTMADVPVPIYQKYWGDLRASLKTAYKGLSTTHPDAVASMHQLFQVLCDIEDIARITGLPQHRLVRVGNGLP